MLREVGGDPPEPCRRKESQVSLRFKKLRELVGILVWKRIRI